jgi:hypothetical protein
VPFMTRLPADLAAFGLRVETVPGWQTRGSSAFAPGCVVGHWTAGPRGTTKRPSLNVVLNGRPDLPGPLCNVYLTRDGVCVVVAAGRANHAGAGGFRGLVGNSAAYGVEAEAADNDDWTDAQRAAYPRLVAAMLHGLSRDASWFCGHSEWAGPRKTDINGYTPGVLRSQAAAILANPQQEDDMPLSDSDIERIRRAVSVAPIGDNGSGKDLELFHVLGPAYRELTQQLPNRIDGKTKDTMAGYAVNADAYGYRILTQAFPAMMQQIAGLEAAVSQLATAVASGDSVTAAELKAAVAEALQENVVKVDVSVAGPA